MEQEAHVSVTSYLRSCAPLTGWAILSQKVLRLGDGENRARGKKRPLEKGTDKTHDIKTALKD